MKSFLVCVGLAVCVITTTASTGRPVDVAARAKKAATIVVATVAEVEAGRFQVSPSGDQLIVTRSWLRVEETLKGQPQQLVAIDVEGGTVGDLTLKVSDLQPLKQGDHGVFFLQPTPDGAHVPSGRGQGILKLDASGRAADTGLTLADVKSKIRAALQ
jgi:hypothetical protein